MLSIVADQEDQLSLDDVYTMVNSLSSAISSQTALKVSPLSKNHFAELLNDGLRRNDFVYEHRYLKISPIAKEVGLLTLEGIKSRVQDAMAAG